MRQAVLVNLQKNLVNSDPISGEELQKELESTKWYLWHGNVEKALYQIDDCCSLVMDDEIRLSNEKIAALFRRI